MADFSSRSKIWGLQVHIRQDEQHLSQSTNQYLRHHHDIVSNLRSRTVTLDPRKPVEVTLNIERGFQRFSETGLEIVIASEYTAQSFWIDYAQCAVTGPHVFSSFTTWSSPADEVARQNTPLPALRASYVSTTPSIAHEGYMSVWIRRGNLSALRDELPGYRWLPTHPPKAARHTRSVQARIIRPHWFQPLMSKHGQAYVFEFRNIASGRRNYVVPPVALGPSNAVIKNVNAQTLPGKLGGSKDVLRRQLKVMQNALDDASGGLKRSASTSDIGMQSKRICLPTPQSSPPAEVIVKEEDSSRATAHHNQREAGVYQTASTNYTNAAEPLHPRPSLATPTCNPVKTARERILVRLPAFLSGQQTSNMTSEVGSDDRAGDHEDLQPIRPFDIGEAIPLAETQTWKAYYETKFIE